MRATQFYPRGPIKGWYASGPDTAFMVPACEYFETDEAKELNKQLEDGGYEEGAGWFHRLTAPGYLDCTEWSGPFPTFYRCLRSCLLWYEIDLNGHTIEY